MNEFCLKPISFEDSSSAADTSDDANENGWKTICNALTPPTSQFGIQFAGWLTMRDGTGRRSVLF